MKMLILSTLLISHTVFAQTLKDDHYFGVKDLVELPEFKTSQPLWAENWNLYKTDSCTLYNKANSNEEELRDLGLRRCQDNSVSFVQPESTGAGGWEGKCGQTFGANSLYSICGLAVDPNSYFNPYFKDLTPGVRPGTLTKGMHSIFKRNSQNCPTGKNTWVYSKLGNNNNFIQKLKQYLVPKYSHQNQIQINRGGQTYLRNPIGVLIQNPGGKYLHWVTVIDVLSDANACRFVVNHWDNQYQLPCEKLASWSGQVGKTYPIVLKSYSTVVYK